MIRERKFPSEGWPSSESTYSPVRRAHSSFGWRAPDDFDRSPLAAAA
jgi:hypothetical protein